MTEGGADQIAAWLEEGLGFYTRGDPARALEAWYRILDVDPAHGLAQQYVAYVRQVYHLDAVHTPARGVSKADAVAAAEAATQAPPTTNAQSVPVENAVEELGFDAQAPAAPAQPVAPVVEEPPPAPPAAAPAATPASTSGFPAPPSTDADKTAKTSKSSLLGYDLDSSWSDLVDSAFDVSVPNAPPVVEAKPPAPPPPTPPPAPPARPPVSASTDPWAPRPSSVITVSGMFAPPTTQVPPAQPVTQPAPSSDLASPTAPSAIADVIAQAAVAPAPPVVEPTAPSLSAASILEPPHDAEIDVEVSLENLKQPPPAPATLAAPSGASQAEVTLEPIAPALEPVGAEPPVLEPVRTVAPPASSPTLLTPAPTPGPDPWGARTDPPAPPPAASFDPWGGDSVPPKLPPSPWGAGGPHLEVDIELPPPTPPPVVAEAALEIDIATDDVAAPPPSPPVGVSPTAATWPPRPHNPEPPPLAAVSTPPPPASATAPTWPPQSSSSPGLAAPPAWKAAAREEVGGGARSSTGAARVDVVPESSRPTARPAQAPVEERVLKQSVRYNDYSNYGSSSSPAPSTPSPPTPGTTTAPAAASSTSVAAVATMAPAVEAKGAVVDPWDEVAGPGGVVNLDQAPRSQSSLEDIFGGTASEVDAWMKSEPPPPPVEDECTALMRGARELFDLGDFSGSLDLVEKVLKINPTHEGAQSYMKRNESMLIKMYESKLGDLRRSPRQAMPPDEVIWMNMHHKAGFILSQVDGQLTYEDILEISGMPRFDTMRILSELVGQGIIK